MRSVRSLLLLLSFLLPFTSITVLTSPEAANAAGGSLLVSETFGGTSVADSDWRALGEACLTHATAAPPTGSSNLANCATRSSVAPPTSENPGFLRLTDAATGRSGGVVYDKPIPGNGGLVVEFDQWQYGGGGADGIGFFLTDGSATLSTTGASGGSLGYAPSGSSDGVNSGYLGVGFDAWGNYASSEGGVKDKDCVSPNISPGRTSNIVGLRGPGQGKSGYCWLTGTLSSAGHSNLPASLRGSNYSAAQGRHVKITVSADALPTVTVEIDFHDGNGSQTVLSYQMTQPAPATYKLGFLGSTGSVTDVHLVRNVSISSLVPLGDLNIVKQIDNRTTQPAFYKEGDTVPYTFLVSNASELARLTDVAVVDPKAQNISCPRTSLETAGSLNSSMLCTGSHKLTAAEAVAGSPFTNTAHATAMDSGNAVTSENSTARAAIATPAPALKIVKRAIVDESVVANGYADPGEKLTYSFDVTNTGNVTVTDVAVADPQISAAITPASQTLAPGETKTFTTSFSRTVTQGDIDNGVALTNTASASGVTLNNLPVGPVESTAAVQVTPASPKLVIEKTATLGDEVTDNDVADVGETITYGFVVRNAGNVTISNVSVVDAKVSGLDPAQVASLAPNESASFTAAPYVVTQADVDSGGSVTNSATAKGTVPAGGSIESEPSVTQVEVAPQVPAIFLDKTAALHDGNGSAVAEAGETIVYTFSVVNTGNVTLRNVGITDARIAGTTPSSIDQLAPGATAEYTAEYTVTQADVDAGGQILNTATAHGTSPSNSQTTSNESSAQVPVPTASAALSLTKTATLDDANGNHVADAGETISYAFVVTNNGNVTVRGVTINDPGISGVSPASVPSLTPGQSATFSAASRTVTQEDIDAGVMISNTATAAGTVPGGGTVSSPESEANTPVAAAVIDLRIDKIATLDDSVIANGDADAGETIAYSFVVTNGGNVTLHNVRVDDPGVQNIAPAVVAELAPNESVTFTADPVSVTQADVDRGGSLVNTALARADQVAGGDVVSPPDTAATPLVAQTPGLTIVKEPVFDDTDADGRVSVGELISYRFTVKNTGNITLADVRIADERVSGITPESVTLEPQAERVFESAARPVTQDEIDAGVPLENVATASGLPPQAGVERFVSAPSQADVNVALAEPNLVLTKTAEYSGANAGDVVTYHFLVKNTGNVTLHGIELAEKDFTGRGELSGFTCPQDMTLAPGGTLECTATYVLEQGDVDAGRVDNTATATAVPPVGSPVESDDAVAFVMSPPEPSLTLTKTADRAELVAGQTVTYTFLVENTGNVTMDDIAVNESEFTGTGELSDIDCPTAVLSPQESFACQATYVVSQDDVDNGAVANTATVEGAAPSDERVSSEPSTVTLTANQVATLTVVKSADTSELTVGQTVTFSFVVTNTGSVTLRDVGVVDQGFSGAGTMSALECPEETSLAPNAQLTCQATYVVQQADVDAGRLENSAIATGTPPTGEPVVSDPSIVRTDQELNPALTIVKSVDATDLVVDEEITYSFLVTNTGNVTLSDVGIDEADFTGAGELSAPECPDSEPLLPGEQRLCTASYVVQQDDVDAGTLSNTATVTATPPSGDPVVSEPSTSVVTGVQTPALTIVKTADKTEVRRDEKLTYTFTATNTGNVTLTDLEVIDRDFTGVGDLSELTCDGDVRRLAPGTKLVCTASYVVQRGDVDAGVLSNTAVVQATPPGGDPRPGPIVSDPSSISVDVLAGALPRTGSDLDPRVIGLGVLMLLTGGAFVFFAHRGRRSKRE